MGLFDIFSEIDFGEVGTEEKWNYIRAGIEIGVTSDLSQNAIASALREVGLSFGNDPFRALYREISNYTSSFEYQRRIGADLKPNPELMVNSRFELTGEYGYVGKFYQVNEQTGLLDEITFRIDSDSLLSRNEATSEMEDFINNNSPDVQERIIGVVEFVGSLRSI